MVLSVRLVVAVASPSSRAPRRTACVRRCRPCLQSPDDTMFAHVYGDPFVPPVEVGCAICVAIGGLAGLHIVAKCIAPGMLRPPTCDVGIVGSAVDI